MTYEANVHPAQTLILRHLLFVTGAGFASLQKQTGLSSDHFNFHIKRLVETGLVEKAAGQYRLTRLGKEYANRMDTDENAIEKQPKISVALIVERQKDGQRQFLAQQRLKQPYFGFWGRLGGKVRWGESFETAAARELNEETGLTGDFSFKLIFHKRDYRRKDGQLLEDKIFVVMYSNNCQGNLNEEFEGGLNRWMSEAEFAQLDNIFESARDFVKLVDAGVSYHAQEYNYDDSEY